MQKQRELIDFSNAQAATFSPPAAVALTVEVLQNARQTGASWCCAREITVTFHGGIGSPSPAR
jgi:hypothetical protein